MNTAIREGSSASRENLRARIPSNSLRIGLDRTSSSCSSMILCNAASPHKDASPASLLDAALATAAAPTYFPSHKVGNETILDGGLIANAPELIAITEAIRWRKIDL